MTNIETQWKNESIAVVADNITKCFYSGDELLKHNKRLRLRATKFLEVNTNVGLFTAKIIIDGLNNYVDSISPKRSEFFFRVGKLIEDLK